MGDHNKVVDKLSEMEECLVNYLKSQLDQGIECLPNCVEVAGQVTDMVKDIAEAKRNCLEAKYYKSVTEAMDDYGDYVEDMADAQKGRMGYNPHRAANGRYARSGFHPYYDDPMMGGMVPPMGYTPRGMGNRSQSGNRSGYIDGMDDWGYERGKDYEQYRNARRGYTESHSEMDRKRMHEHGEQYVTNAVAAIMEIMADADPDMKQRMKSQLMPLINGM